MTSLATAISGMKHWDWCPICRGALDTGLECDQCGADLMPVYKAFKDLQARPSDSVVMKAIKARADRSRLGYGGKVWVTSDPKSEVVEDRMLLVEIVCRQEFSINRLRSALNEAADSFKNAGLSVDAEACEEAIDESLSGGNPGEPKACTGAEERGISGATGAGQLPDGNPESTGDSAERRSPAGHRESPAPDESNRHFERGCFVIMELMQAYERRVRSDCTPEQLDKRPWKCFEYLKAAEYLRAVWPPHEPAPAEAIGKYMDGWESAAFALAEVVLEKGDYNWTPEEWHRQMLAAWKPNEPPDSLSIYQGQFRMLAAICIENGGTFRVKAAHLLDIHDRDTIHENIDPQTGDRIYTFRKHSVTKGETP